MSALRLWTVVAVLGGCAASAPDDEPDELAQSQYDVARWFTDHGYTVQDCGLAPKVEGVRGNTFCVSGPATEEFTVWTYGSEGQAAQALRQVKTRKGVGVSAETRFVFSSGPLGARRIRVYQSGPIVVYLDGSQREVEVQRHMARIVGPPR